MATGTFQKVAAAMTTPILAFLNQCASAAAVLGAAGRLAAALPAAEIVAFHIRPGPRGDLMPSEEIMTEADFAARVAEIETRAAALKEIFHTWQASHAPIRARFVSPEGETVERLLEAAQEAAFIVLARPPAHHYADSRVALHTALFRARRPVLLVPPDPLAESLGRHPAIAIKPGAFDPEGPTAHAIGAALPLLNRAEEVAILVAEADTNPAEPAPAIAALLARLRGDGVPARLDRFAPGAEETGRALLARAHACGADLLIMGAYGRGEVVEFILGGVTRGLLAAADLPVLLHH